MDFKRRVAESLASWEEKAPPGWETGPSAVGPGDAASPELDPDFLLGLANATMPFGKYEGRLLIDLPEAYVLWFERQDFPEGLLGRQLQALLVIKANGMEAFLRPLVVNNG
jgi:uncharacterized protein (DUF3820 family)